MVFVILESTRARSVTPYAREMATTPFLGRLAERGLRVEHAYAVVPHTSKALVPIQCGVHPKITTAIQEANPGGIPSACLAELLGAQGYATAFIQPAEEEFERRRGLVANFGFQTFLGKESLPTGFEESSYFGYEDDSMLEPALAWVDRQTGPFFLTVLTLTAHHDYRLPKSFPKRELAAEESLNRYLNALAYTDRFVERLFAGFDQRSLLAQTLFVIVGDHGEAFGEHGRSEHDNVLYEEGVAVPLLLVGAGLEEMRGRAVGGLRETSDIVPTVAGGPRLRGPRRRPAGHEPPVHARTRTALLLLLVHEAVHGPARGLEEDPLSLRAPAAGGVRPAWPIRSSAATSCRTRSRRKRSRRASNGSRPGSERTTPTTGPTHPGRAPSRRRNSRQRSAQGQRSPRRAA